MLVGVEPQMLELMQYALAHHIGKSLVPAKGINKSGNCVMSVI